MAEKKFRNNYLFDYLKNILTEKSMEKYYKHLEDDFELSYQPFMVNNYLSMSLNPAVRKVIFNYQLSLDRMDNKTHYLFLLKTVPRQETSFIKYVR